MDIFVHKPTKKKDYFASKVTNARNDNIRLKITGSEWIHLRPLESGGYMLRLFLAKDSDAIPVFKGVDSEVLSQTLLRNHSWFPNALTEDQVHAYFRPTVHPNHSSVGLLLSPYKEPTIHLNGAVLESMEQLEGVQVPNDAHLVVEVETQAVCFFRQQFGVRWIVRRLWLNTHSEGGVDGIQTDEWVDRREVEHAWEMEMEEFSEKINKEVQVYVDKISQLQGMKDAVLARFQRIQKMEDLKTWNEHLEELSKDIAKYNIF